MKNLIKIWLIFAPIQLWAANTYQFGYFDGNSAKPLKIDTVTQWLRDGLKFGGVKGSVQVRAHAITAESTDAHLKDLDFLITRGDLLGSREILERYKSLGGRIAVSDQWTREDIAVENLGVLSVSLPAEKRGKPLVAWLNQQFPLASRKGVYITQANSDFDKIWYFDLLKNPATKGWELSEISLGAKDTNIDFKKYKSSENFLLLNRFNPELVAVLNASSYNGNVILIHDPVNEVTNDKVAEYFKKNIMTHFITLYPKGLTDEARDFEKANKDILASDVLLHDSLVMAGKGLARADMRVNSTARFFTALDGVSLAGVSGALKIERGELNREVFVVGQRGDARVLEWRSGIVK